MQNAQNSTEICIHTLSAHSLAQGPALGQRRVSVLSLYHMANAGNLPYDTPFPLTLPDLRRPADSSFRELALALFPFSFSTTVPLA